MAISVILVHLFSRWVSVVSQCWVRDHKPVLPPLEKNTSTSYCLHDHKTKQQINIYMIMKTLHIFACSFLSLWTFFNIKVFINKITIAMLCQFPYNSHIQSLPGHAMSCSRSSSTEGACILTSTSSSSIYIHPFLQFRRSSLRETE